LTPDWWSVIAAHAGLFTPAMGEESGTLAQVGKLFVP
jgi:hypothetical protein